jgi:glutathione S-transferase
MPVATIGDVGIGQSAAINHYFASQYGLMGKDNIEAAQIVSVSEHLKEMIASFRTLVAWNKVPDPAALDKWFEGGAVDLTGMADRPGQGTRYMKWWMGRMETVMGPNGFAVGSKLSLADILLYYTLKDSLSPEQAAPGVPRWRCEPFCDSKRTDAALAKHPKILASCEKVATNPNIQKWLSMRGVNTF